MRLVYLPSLILIILGLPTHSLTLPQIKSAFPTRESAVVKPFLLKHGSSIAPQCFEEKQAPYPGFKALERDCTRVAELFDEEDIRRHSLLASFAEKDVFPPGSVDIIVPHAKKHRTCRSGAAMDSDHKKKKGHAFLFELALATKWIYSYCSTRGGIGGAVRIGEGVAVALYGRPDTGPGNAVEENETIADELDSWATSMLQKLTDDVSGGSDVVSNTTDHCHAKTTSQSVTTSIKNIGNSGSFKPKTQQIETN